jgi:hypothetical protein
MLLLPLQSWPWFPMYTLHHLWSYYTALYPKRYDSSCVTHILEIWMLHTVGHQITRNCGVPCYATYCQYRCHLIYTWWQQFLCTL